MNLTEELAIEIAKKALGELGFGTNDLLNPMARYTGAVENESSNPDSAGWLVSFEFNFGGFDIYPRHKAFIAIRDADGIARNISIPRELILLGYDPETDKYFKKPRPQPK